MADIENKSAEVEEIIDVVENKEVLVADETVESTSPMESKENVPEESSEDLNTQPEAVETKRKSEAMEEEAAPEAEKRMKLDENPNPNENKADVDRPNVEVPEEDRPTMEEPELVNPELTVEAAKIDVKATDGETSKTDSEAISPNLEMEAA